MLLFATWLRSYWKCNYFVHVGSGNRTTVVGSNQGAFYMIRTPPAQLDPALPAGWLHRVQSAIPLDSINRNMPAHSQLTIIPIWSLIALVAALAGAPSISFSLRTLLIAMALVATVLGLAVYSCG